MFSLVHAVFLRSLPFPRPERIVMLFETVPSARVDRQGFSPANYSDLKARQQVFSHMSGLLRSEMTLTGAGEPERLEGFTLMDRDAFDILGVTPGFKRATTCRLCAPRYASSVGVTSAGAQKLASALRNRRSAGSTPTTR